MFKLNRFVFFIFNFLLTTLVFILIYKLRYSNFFLFGVEKRGISNGIVLLFCIYSFIYTIFNIAMKIYEVNKISNFIESFLSTLTASILSMLVIGFYFYFTQTTFARFVFFTGFLILPFFISLFNKVLFLSSNRKNTPLKVIYLGSKKNFMILTELLKHNEKWFKRDLIKYSLDKKITSKIKILENVKILFLDTDQNYNKNYLKTLSDFEINGGKIYPLTEVFALFEESLPIEIIERSFYNFFSRNKIDSYYNKYIKRVLDIMCSFLLLIILSPLFISVILLLKITLRGNIFFLQKRASVNNKNFLIIKFKTMKEKSNSKKIFTEKNDSRVTFIGKLLRKVRIDELPQLINVLKGDMSLIGPRPERPEIMKLILKKYPFFQKRLLIKPGLTGWAQVKFDYVSKIEDMNKKLGFDLYYIKNISFSLDIKILLYTLETIIFRRGAI